MRTLRGSALLFWAIALAASAHGAGELFHCEVLALEGNVRAYTASGSSTMLQEGDLLSEGDSLDVSEEGWVDLAYDKDWNNVVRVEGGTKIKLTSVSPAKIELTEGGVYAKLKSLPKKSGFEIQTPTAIAAVRGTEYRATVTDGRTGVFNFSSSRVYVYGMDGVGQPSETATVLEQDQKTAVESRGEIPERPIPMSAAEVEAGKASQAGIEAQVARVTASGRVGKIQTVAEIEQEMTSAESRARYDDESRFTDTRRRTFK